MRCTAAGRAAVSLLLVPAACSSEPGNRAAQVDIANAAETPLVRAALTAPPVRRTTPVPAETADAGADNVVGEAPFAAASAQGAADVVQRYFAAIEAGKYRDAWALWDDDGRASGMSAEAFAASFAKYREYHAEVGAPGRVDAGAGQRFVTVPVKAYGRLNDGGDFAMQGEVTLHRVADIDGASAAQRSWRISTSGLKPRPQ